MRSKQQPKSRSRQADGQLPCYYLADLLLHPGSTPDPPGLTQAGSDILTGCLPRVCQLRYCDPRSAGGDPRPAWWGRGGRRY